MTDAQIHIVFSFCLMSVTDAHLDFMNIFRYQTALKHGSTNTNTIKEELEDAELKVEQCRVRNSVLLHVYPLPLSFHHRNLKCKSKVKLSCTWWHLRGEEV
jgi:hypothetical protein